MRIKTKFFNLKEINSLMEEDIKKVIAYAESEYRGQLFELANKVYKKKNCKIVLIAGGSCAGKTTTTRLLKEILEKMGREVISISLDDFFKNRVDTPLLPNGNKDYDSVNALTLDELTECFEKLFGMGESGFPSYDFITGIHHSNFYKLKWKPGNIILFEGLHTISPEITERLGTKDLFKVYVSPTSGFEVNGEKMRPKDLRFIRRAVRDVSRRGHSIVHTFNYWEDVLEGERKYIDPYTKKCDFLINTSHCFELGLYKPSFIEDYSHHIKELPKFTFLDIIKSAKDFNRTLLPLTSLMWEFIDKN